ncbi:MAG: zinc metalloprotease HtpX [Acidilobaceae archaeon]
MFEFMVAYWWVLLIEGLAVALVVGLLALYADKIVGDAPKSLGSLRAGMALSLIAMVSGYIVVVVVAFKALEWYTGFSISASSIALTASLMAFLLILVQWLISPLIINIAYRTRSPRSSYEQELEMELKRLAERAGMKTPKFVIADVDFPNAFAYGSPIFGNYVAITRGLLKTMPKEEILGVIGHELGHLKHRDVAWILALSTIPLAVYFLGRALVWMGIFRDTSANTRRTEATPIVFLAIGGLLIVASVIFRLLIVHFSRLREYYADAHSAMLLGTSRPLQRALARLYLTYNTRPDVSEMARENSTAALLFIIAPLIELWASPFYEIDYHVERLKEIKTNALEELLSTHPPIPKRLKFLDRVAQRL